MITETEHHAGGDEARKIRNIGIVAHIDAGKTTLTERILYVTDAIRRMGEVQEGTTVTDWMTQERERGISICSAAVHCNWRGYHINVVDTPGHIDFTAEVERSLSVMDGVVAVFCGVKGVQAQSESVWKRAERYRLPVIAFVNKMDRDGADGRRVLSQIEERFNVRALPVVYPLRKDGVFHDVLDLTIPLDREALSTVGTELEQVELLEWRERLLETLSEVDDTVMASFLERREPEKSAVRAALRKAVIRRKVVPVYFGSSLENIGVNSLLDGVCRYMPSPLEHRCAAFPEAASGTSLFLFRVGDSPDGTGRLGCVRVLSGQVRPGLSLMNLRTRRPIRTGRVGRLQAQMLEEIPFAVAGDIVAVKGEWTNCRIGDILCEHEASVKAPRMQFPQPVLSVNFSSVTDGERLGAALKALCREDPTLHMKELLPGEAWAVSGMGELHTEIVKDRLKSDYGIEARLSEPRVEYRETVAGEARLEKVFEKRFPGGSVTASVELEITPLARGNGFRLEGMESLCDISALLRKSLSEGIMMVVNGEAGGFPLTDMKVTLRSASANGMESALGPALVMAARNALEDALLQAGRVVLEPVMLLEINTPAETLGNVIADLKSRHGDVVLKESDASGGARIVAKAPLAGLFGYASSLRSMSAGRGEVVAEPMAYCEKGG